MGISFLRPLLQSLCCNTPWCYAVFWKVNYQNEMILAWEDGFCKDVRTGTPLGHIEDIHFGISSNLNPTLIDGTPSDYPIELAVAEMSSTTHVFGTGVVGEVAFTGIPNWIYSDDIATDVYDSLCVVEYPDELLLQFIAGIKTVLLLPVLPHGVLQLGSLEMVAEDNTLVAYARQKFESDNRFAGYETESPFQKFSFISAYLKNFEQSSTITGNESSGDKLGAEELNLGAANQMMPAFVFQDLCKTLATGVTCAHKNQINHKASMPSIGAHVADSQASHLTCEDPDVAEVDFSKSICLDDKTKVFLYFENFLKHDKLTNELVDFERVLEPSFMVNDFDESGSSLSSFLNQCELNKPLGPDLYDSSSSGHYAASHSINDRYLTPKMNLSRMDSALSLQKEEEMESLFVAVTADSLSSSDDNSANQPNVEMAWKASTRIPLASSRKPNKTKRRASPEEDTVPFCFFTSSLIDHGMNAPTTFSPSASSIEHKMDVFVDKQLQQGRNGYYNLNPRKRSRLSSTNNRNICAVNNQRARPRDRQLIQDRIKELRELVPNTDRSSIDGLLDKTIKHMLFLQDVTNRAVKLRHQSLKEEKDRKTTKTAEIISDHQNGTSWAVELGNEHQQCQIVVKDLDHPGQISIEMLCTDHGHFMEIADIIQRLQLTILKAVMEKCSENSWARFIVETSGSFQRLDIFWPLMQLLQRPTPKERKM